MIKPSRHKRKDDREVVVYVNKHSCLIPVVGELSELSDDMLIHLAEGARGVAMEAHDEWAIRSDMRRLQEPVLVAS